MERHHLLGRGFPDLVVPLCLNCHALVTELERVTGATARTPDETDTHRTLWRALVWMALLYTSWVRVSREVFRVLDRALRSPEEENSIPGRLLAPVRELLHFLQAQEPETTNRIELYVSRCLSALADEDPEKLAVLQKLSSSLRVPVKGQCY
ncbi:MAG: hypothetical protein QN144_13675 [Armatimonadota bacterium]|nr:hypothetical protein [Armatimonadota bacterium]